MVLILLAEGFEEIEALTPADVLRRAGCRVFTVGVTGDAVTGSHGIEVKSDISRERALEMLSEEKLEAVIFPGGMPGASNLDASPFTDEVLSFAERDGAYVAAICAAPMILGKRGLLKGKDATCYPGFEKYLEGASLFDASVVVDGNTVTADGMGSALDFAFELAALLKGEDEKERLIEAVRA